MPAPTSAIVSTSAMLCARPLVRAAAVARTPRMSPAAAAIAVWSRGYATPSGPPPKGFRLRPQPEWDQEKEGTFDKAGKYFLLTEMARGMYVLLEQFFRPP
jgi:NADH dehydrogenase (ubiquinone) Fe-S protein 8